MKRPALLVVLAVLAAAVTGLLLLLNSGSGSLPPEAPAVRNGSEGEGETLQTGLDEDQPPVREAVAGPDAAAVAAVEDELLADPVIRAALTGFRGRIVDAGGRPVPDCGVRVFRIAADSALRPGVGVMAEGLSEMSFVAGNDETDEEGRFLVDGVWPRGIYLLLGGIGTDFPTHRVLQQTPPPGEILDLGDIQLAEGAVVTGVVVDEDGDPVAGALVRGVDLPGQITGMFPIERFDPDGAVILREGDAPTPVIEMPPWVRQIYDNLPVPKTETDEEGAFRLGGLVPGPNMIAVTHPGFLSDVKPSVPLRAGQERDLGRIRLRVGEEVIGKVLDSAGKPVAGAQVVAAPTTSIAPVDLASYLAPTDEEGCFHAVGFPSGKVTVAARRGPADPWVVAEPQSIYQDVVVVLPATHRLDVGLVSAVGSDLTEPRLRLLPGSGDEGTLEMAMLGFLPRVDLSERLTELEDGRLRIVGLASGRYYLLADAEGHGVGGVSVDLQGDREVVVTLPAQKRFPVRVVDSEGRGIRNAAIYARQFGAETRSEIPIHCGYTGGDGRLVVDETDADRLKITADHPAYGAVDAEARFGTGETVMRMAVPGAIAGTVTENGRPPEPGKWTVVVSAGSGERSGPIDEMPAFAVPDEKGEFTVRGLQPRTYDVTLIKSLDAVRSFGSMMSLAQTMFLAGEPQQVQAQVPAGGTASVQLEANPERVIEGPAARITGTVLVDGAAAEGMVMLAWTSQGRFVSKLDPAGRFDLGLVPEGSASMTLFDENMDGFRGPGSGSLWNRELEVVGGEDQDLMIEVQTGSLSGTVVFEDGTPAQHAMVSARGRIEGGGDDSWFNTNTDARGRFEFERMPAGTYSLDARVLGERSARGELTAVQVVPGLPTTGTRLTVRGTVTVSGRVDLSRFGEEKPGWVSVSFQVESDDEEGGYERVESASVDDDGKFSADGLLPGTYHLRIYHSGEREAELVHPEPVIVGPEGLEGLVVIPTPRSTGG